LQIITVEATAEVPYIVDHGTWQLHSRLPGGPLQDFGHGWLIGRLLDLPQHVIR
jgi:hypothetical protein